MGLLSYIFNELVLEHLVKREKFTVECEIRDPKQGSMMRSGRALGWLRQKLIPQASTLVVEVRKFSVQTSYRPLKAGTTRFGALQNPKVIIQSLKKLN
jgi:hypothetical protein